MKNYVQPGDTITVVAPADVVSGQLVTVGSIVGVAKCDAAPEEEVEISVEGVFDLAKVPADSLAAGDIAKADASGNIAIAGVKAIGWVLSSAAAGATTARVRLTPGIA